MKKFEVTWLETRQFKCSIVVDVESVDDAYDKAAMIEFPDHEEETSKPSKFEKYLECREIK